jgi:hypothetical protein
MVENADPPRVRVAAARSGTEPVERSQNAVENRWVSMRELFTGTRSRNDGGALDRLQWGPERQHLTLIPQRFQLLSRSR